MKTLISHAWDRISRFFIHRKERIHCLRHGHDPAVDNIGGYRFCRNCGALLKDGKEEGI